MPRLSGSERLQLIGAHQGGKSLRQLAPQFNVSYATARNTWKQRERRPLEQVDLNRTGRPRKTSAEADKRLYRRTRIDPKMSNRDLSQMAGISKRTVKRRLREVDSNYIHSIAKIRPCLTPAHIAARLQYARDNRKITLKEWCNNWYSDECSVALSDGIQREWVWKHSGETFLPDMIQPKDSVGPSVMI